MDSGRRAWCSHSPVIRSGARRGGFPHRVGPVADRLERRLLDVERRHDLFEDLVVDEAGCSDAQQLAPLGLEHR